MGTGSALERRLFLEHPSHDRSERPAAHPVASLDFGVGGLGEADTSCGFPHTHFLMVTPSSQQFRYSHASRLGRLRGARQPVILLNCRTVRCPWFPLEYPMFIGDCAYPPGRFFRHFAGVAVVLGGGCSGRPAVRARTWWWNRPFLRETLRLPSGDVRRSSTSRPPLGWDTMRCVHNIQTGDL